MDVDTQAPPKDERFGFEPAPNTPGRSASKTVVPPWEKNKNKPASKEQFGFAEVDDAIATPPSSNSAHAAKNRWATPTDAGEGTRDNSAKTGASQTQKKKKKKKRSGPAAATDQAVVDKTQEDSTAKDQQAAKQVGKEQNAGAAKARKKSVKLKADAAKEQRAASAAAKKQKADAAKEQQQRAAAATAAKEQKEKERNAAAAEAESATHQDDEEFDGFGDDNTPDPGTGNGVTGMDHCRTRFCLARTTSMSTEWCA